MPNKPIIVGSIVKYQDGWYKVSCLRGGKVNLKAIFGDHIYFKGVLVGDVVEDEANWYEHWTQSETYKCM